MWYGSYHSSISLAGKAQSTLDNGIYDEKVFDKLCTFDLTLTNHNETWQKVAKL